MISNIAVLRMHSQSLHWIFNVVLVVYMQQDMERVNCVWFAELKHLRLSVLSSKFTELPPRVV